MNELLAAQQALNARSTLPGVVWPTFAAPNALPLMSFLWQFERTQWWDPKTLFAAQCVQLRQLLAHAFEHSSFYRQRLEAAGYRLGQAVNVELMAQLPLLTRTDLQQEAGNMRCEHYPKGHGGVFSQSTSGATGTPVTVVSTALNGQMQAAIGLRDHRWHKRDLTGRLACIRSISKQQLALMPDDLHADTWGQPMDILFETGDAWFLSINTPVDRQVEWLDEVNPDYLLTYPSNLVALAQIYSGANRRLPALREIGTISEQFLHEAMLLCEEVFDVPVKDIYSCSEAGLLASQCPEFTHYHEMAEKVFIELLNDDNEPCKPGEVGRVVITDLHNFAMPIIRYDIGDYAERGAPCPCGRGLPVLNEIKGRVRGLITLPSGERFVPRLMITEFSELAGVELRQIQIVQKSLEEVEVRLVTTTPLNDEQAARLTKGINRRLQHAFNISYSYHDAIPRNAGDKFEDFISEVTR